MKNKKVIIFDFDGTIADTLEVIVKIYNNIAGKWGYKLIKREDKERLRAKRPQDALSYCGISTLRLPFLLLQVRKELNKHIINVRPVNSIEEGLKKIKNAGYNLGILTSNSKDNVDIFLKKNNLASIFDFVYTGMNYFGKDKVLRRLLKAKSISKKDAIYVGDETRDIEAARRIGVPIVSVSWGFNTKEILVAYKPNCIADKPDSLLKCIGEILLDKKA